MLLSSPRLVFLLSLTTAVLIALPLLLQAYMPAAWPLDVAEHAVGRDFVNIWAAGRLILEGKSTALFDVQGYIRELHRVFHPALAPHYWSYPPTNFFLAVPFALPPYALALIAWTVAGLAAILWATRIGLAPDERTAVTVLMLIAPATFTNIICGQNGFLTGAALAGTFLLLASHPLLAGVLVGLLSLKPHLAIVAMPALVALGAWRTILAAGLTAVGLVLASLLVFGQAPWTGFLAVTVPNQGLMLANFQGFFTTMLVSPYATLRHLGLAHGMAMMLQAAIAVGTIAVVMLAVRRTQDATERLGLVVAGTFVASPYALTYDLPVVALVVARLGVMRQAPWTPEQGMLYTLLLMLPLASPMLVRLGLPVAGPLMMALLASLALQAFGKNYIKTAS